MICKKWGSFSIQFLKGKHTHRVQKLDYCFLFSVSHCNACHPLSGASAQNDGDLYCPNENTRNSFFEEILKKISPIDWSFLLEIHWRFSRSITLRRTLSKLSYIEQMVPMPPRSFHSESWRTFFLRKTSVILVGMLLPKKCLIKKKKRKVKFSSAWAAKVESNLFLKFSGMLFDTQASTKLAFLLLQIKNLTTKP